MERRTFLELLAGAIFIGCEARTERLHQDQVLVADAGFDDAGFVDAGSIDSGQEYVIDETFDVVLNDNDCSGHPHGLRVDAAVHRDDTPVRFLGGSHEVALRPSELVLLMQGERIPFATVGEGPGHGHCGTAWRTSVGGPDPSREEACVLLPVAECIMS